MNKRILYRYVIPAIMLAITSVIVLNLIKDTKLRGEMIQAVKHGSFQDIDDALAHGADINLKMEAGNTPLHSIAYKGDPNRMKFIIRKGADLEARDLRGGTPLHWAVRNGKIRNVKALLALGADVNSQDSKDQTPLHTTVTALKINEATKLANTRVLISGGADPFITDITGRTPLDYAREKNMKYLIYTLELHMKISE